MEEVKFKITSAEGESFSFDIPACGSNFFHFPNKPYREDPEFTNCWVLGSGGTNKLQIIIRAQPQGHKHNFNPHINIDYAYWDPERARRIRQNDMKTLDMTKELEIIQEFKGKKFIQKINLEDLK